MKKIKKIRKSIKQVVATFDLNGKATCPSCGEYLSPYLYIKGEGKSNLFKCICKKLVKVIYPENVK